MNNFAWHVTPTRNIESIIKRGLIPNMPEEEGELAISLFKTKEDALRETSLWLDKKWNNIPLSILKVDISGRNIVETFYYEWITTDLEPINPERILEILPLDTLQIKEKHKNKHKRSSNYKNVFTPTI